VSTSPNDALAANRDLALLLQSPRLVADAAECDVAMRRRTILVVTAICALCVLLAWFYVPRGPEITGKVSSHDLAAIESLVHRTIGRRPILPDYSWQSLRQLPQAIRRPRGRIVNIAAADGAVQVEALLASPREKGITRGVTCTLKKSANTWEITAYKFWIGPESLR